jgi:hypothetical protein
MARWYDMDLHSSLLAVLELMCRFVVKLAKIRLVGIDRELVPHARGVSIANVTALIAPGKWLRVGLESIHTSPYNTNVISANSSRITSFSSP